MHRARLALIAALAVVAVIVTYVVVDRISTTPEPDAEAFCDEIESIAELDAALGNLDTAAVQAAIPHLESLELASPLEIRAQVTTLRTTVESLATTMAEAPSGDTEAIEAAWRTRQADVEAIAEASAAVVAYTQRTCGVALGSTGTTTGTSPGGTSTTATTVLGGP